MKPDRELKRSRVTALPARPDTLHMEETVRADDRFRNEGQVTTAGFDGRHEFFNAVHTDSPDMSRRSRRTGTVKRRQEDHHNEQ